jgi:hypothetical protein
MGAKLPAKLVAIEQKRIIAAALSFIRVAPRAAVRSRGVSAGADDLLAWDQSQKSEGTGCDKGH